MCSIIAVDVMVIGCAVRRDRCVWRLSPGPVQHGDSSSAAPTVTSTSRDGKPGHIINVLKACWRHAEAATRSSAWRETVWEGLCSWRGGTDSRCLPSCLSPVFKQEVHKFSEINYENYWNHCNHTHVSLLSQIGGQMSVSFNPEFVFTFLGGSPAPTFQVRPFHSGLTGVARWGGPPEAPPSVWRKL